MKKNILIACALLFISCASKKNIYYFQNVEKELEGTPFNMMKAQKGDILDISIKALNPESVTIFESNQNMVGNNIDLKIFDGYLVNEEGYIEFPIIGKLNVLNKSIKDIEEDILKEIKIYIKDPIIKIRILNYKITVLGEVNRPGTFRILDERYSIPQALGQVGDLTINGDRKNILIIRRENQKTITETIDLTNPDIINSPYYYLNQNDVVYVPPNAPKVSSSGFIGNVGTVTSLISFGLSIILLLTR